MGLMETHPWRAPSAPARREIVRAFGDCRNSEEAPLMSTEKTKPTVSVHDAAATVRRMDAHLPIDAMLASPVVAITMRTARNVPEIAA
jgi:hypothetical protein